MINSFYNNKNVLVTGGCGFIGSHIVELLVESGARVTVLDNLSSGTLKNIKHIENDVTFLRGDITNYQTCLTATNNQEVIFHLAAFISVPESVKNPVQCNAVNVNGTFNLLEAARHNNVKFFTFSSSSAVYGNLHGTAYEHSPCIPTSPYGFSKLIGEQYCKQYAYTFGIRCSILRYFNVYGERQNPHGAYAAVVAKFKELLDKNKPVTIFGDGSQTRDFIHVKKVAEANLASPLHSFNTHKHVTFNIGTGTSITLLDLLDQLKNDFPSYRHDPTFAPARSGDITHSNADCSKYYTFLSTLKDNEKSV